jgi:probable phosphoglycerate mutase
VQKNPAQFTFPKGESFINLHARVRKFQVKLYGEKGPILVVSHGDVIKMLLASVAGLDLNSFQKFVIEPGSISAISIEKSSSKIISTNNLNFSPIKQLSIKESLGGGNSLRRKFFGAIK